MNDYFNDTSYISNSQLRSFVSYNKYGQRLLTPDIYKIYHIDKSMEFQVNDSMIIGKLVDIYFDGTGEKVWDIYTPVTRRKEKNDITKVMEKTAQRMIDRGNAFTKFKEFIELKDTKSQVVLKETLNINGTDIKVKGLPDYVNKKKRLIVDLKTSGSIDMIIDSLQFKGEPKLYAPYIKQLSIYNMLLGGGYDGALALITEKGVKWIDVPNSILEEAQKQIKTDMLELYKFLQNPTSIDESIFIEEELNL